MHHITNDSAFRAGPRGLTEVLVYSDTKPGWKELHKFREVSTEISPFKPACPSYGCKVYEHPDGTQAVMHSTSYGCPQGWRPQRSA